MVCVIPVYHPFQQSFSHITRLSDCERELNAHFYSAASLWYQEAPIAQLGERQTLDRKVAGSILTFGAVLCP